MDELRSQLADIVSDALRLEAPTITTDVLRTQSDDFIWHSLREQIDDIIGFYHRMQERKIFRSTGAEKSEDVFKRLASSLLSPTRRDWVYNEIIGVVLTMVRQKIVEKTLRHYLFLVPGALDEVVTVSGATAPP